MPQAQSTGSTLMPAETGVGSPAAASPGSGAEITAVQGGREDLTVFFSIGLAIDVILVTAFLVWAVGQWRKTKK